MTDFGIQPTGYVRTPLSIFLARLEAAMITQFGPGVIQTPQSPFGQLNGLMADVLSELDERQQDLYQSYDPDQAEGFRLDTLGRLRLLNRNGASDADYRKNITNAGQARIDVKDIASAVLGVPGVTYAQVFTPDLGMVEVPPGTIAVAVMGGDDDDVAEVLRAYVTPGIDAVGNVRVTTTVEGFCRSIGVVRPLEIEADIIVYIKRTVDKFGCPAPSGQVIEDTLTTNWLTERINGLAPSFYRVRSIIESRFNNVEVMSVDVTYKGEVYPGNAEVPVNFYEIVKLDVEVVEV